MLHDVAKEFAIEDLRYRGWPDLHGSGENVPVDRIADRLPHRHQPSALQPLRVIGLAHPGLGSKSPPMKKRRHGNVGMGVEAADYRGGLKSYLVPGDAFRSYVIGVHQVGAVERTFHRGELKRGNVRDIDHLSWIRALVRLIERGQEAQRVSVPVLAEKSARADLGADGLYGKALGKRQAKQIRAEVVNGEHPAKTLRQQDRSVRPQFLATLVLSRVRLPLGDAFVVDHSEILGFELVLIAYRPKDAVLRPSSCGVKRGPQVGVSTPIDCPIKPVSQDGAPGVGLPNNGDKKATLTPQIIHRVLDPWKIEDGDAMDAQGGVMHGSFGAHFHE